MTMCPVCGGDRLADMPMIKRRLAEAGLCGEYVAPGGRLLEFRDGRTLRLHDECSTCDAAKITDFLGHSCCEDLC